MGKILTNANKVRHTKGVRNALLTSLENIKVPKVRIGSSVTADGAVFELSDPRYIGKIIFYRGKTGYAQIIKEYTIGKRLGEIGIAPKFYSMENLQFNTSKLPGNLLSNANMMGPSAVMIIMENLAYGAKKLETLWDYVNRVGVYPTRQVGGLYKKLVARRILHGDLHAGNIMVKTLPSGRIRLYLIDFTRSVELPANKSASNYFKGREQLSNYPGYYYVNDIPVGSNAEILNRNFKRLGKPANTNRISSVSIPKSFFGKSPVRSPAKNFSPSFFKGLKC